MPESPFYRLTEHAREAAEQRGIALEIVDAVMHAPDQVLEVHPKRKIYQSRVEIEGRLYLIRVIVEQSDPILVITIYRTSKIEKYWSRGK